MGRKRNESVDGSTVESVDLPGNGDQASGMPKPKESKRDRFLRLVERRVNNALQRIKHVGNMANKANYEYTPEEANKVVDAIRYACEDMAEAFYRVDSRRTGFTL